MACRIMSESVHVVSTHAVCFWLSDFYPVVLIIIITIIFLIIVSIRLAMILPGERTT